MMLNGVTNWERGFWVAVNLASWVLIVIGLISLAVWAAERKPASGKNRLFWLAIGLIAIGLACLFVIASLWRPSGEARMGIDQTAAYGNPRPEGWWQEPRGATA